MKRFYLFQIQLFIYLRLPVELRASRISLLSRSSCGFAKSESIASISISHEFNAKFFMWSKWHLASVSMIWMHSMYIADIRTKLSWNKKMNFFSLFHLSSLCNWIANKFWFDREKVSQTFHDTHTRDRYYYLLNRWVQ